MDPILFIIYINDVIENIKHSKIWLFADDIALYKEISAVRDAQQLQEDLESLQLWEGTWLLKFSIRKCQVLKTTRATKHMIAFDYCLHNTPLEVVDSCKYLGVTIQHDLRWSEHIQSITAKASRTLSFLRRNLKLNNQQLKETAYFSLVRLQLEYACVIWSPWQRNIQNIEKINRRAARFVTSNYYHTSSVSSMIDQLEWQDLETRRQNFRLCMLFKIIHNQTCIPLSDITSPTTTTSSTIMTRSDVNSVLVPFARTDTYKFSFGPHTCSLWNSLPSHIKGITSIDTFKNHLISNP